MKSSREFVREEFVVSRAKELLRDLESALKQKHDRSHPIVRNVSSMRELSDGISAADSPPAIFRAPLYLPPVIVSDIKKKDENEDNNNKKESEEEEEKKEEERKEMRRIERMVHERTGGAEIRGIDWIDDLPDEEDEGTIIIDPSAPEQACILDPSKRANRYVYISKVV